MYFSSRKDWFFTIIILGLSLGSVALYLLDSNVPTSALFVVCGFVFLLMWIWFGTGYKVEDGKIKIYYGPIRIKVKISEIQKIEKVKSPFTAPALSITRLDIMYGDYKTIQISPEREEELVKLLLEENPDIK